MKSLVQCVVCKKEFWCGFQDRECSFPHDLDWEMARKDEEMCDHVWNGEEYDIIEQELIDAWGYQETGE